MTGFVEVRLRDIERLRAERDAAIAERDEARKLYAGEGRKAMVLAEELSAARAVLAEYDAAKDKTE